MIAACEIPDNVLSALTTRQLLLTCLDYPLMGDALCYRDFSVGFDLVAAHHNGLSNLYERSDISSTLSRLYSSLSRNDVYEADKMVSSSLIANPAVAKNLIAEKDAEIIIAKCDELLCDSNAGTAGNLIADVRQSLTEYYTAHVAQNII